LSAGEWHRNSINNGQNQPIPVVFYSPGLSVAAKKPSKADGEAVPPEREDGDPV
jgi:hypothetical protein